MAQIGISAQQRRAIIALLDPVNRTNGQAAAAAGCSLRSIQRWLEDPAFLAELRTAERHAQAQATRRLIGLQNAAITTMGNLLHDKATRDAVRRAAARDVLELGMRLQEHSELVARLEALEREHGGL